MTPGIFHRIAEWIERHAERALLTVMERGGEAGCDEEVGDA